MLHLLLRIKLFSILKISKELTSQNITPEIEYIFKTDLQNNIIKTSVILKINIKLFLFHYVITEFEL